MAYIPSTFMLAGNIWQVDIVGKKHLLPYSDGVAVLGLCIPMQHTILLYKKQTDAALMQAFLHEAMHAVLYTMGHNDHDEVFVEGAAQLAFQLLVTSGGDDDEPNSTEETTGEA